MNIHDSIRSACNEILRESSYLKNPEKVHLALKIQEIYEACVEAEEFNEPHPLLNQITKDIADIDTKEQKKVIVARILSMFDENNSNKDSNDLASQIYKKIFPKIKFEDQADVRIVEAHNKTAPIINVKYQMEDDNPSEKSALERVTLENIDQDDLSIEQVTTLFENELKKTISSKEVVGFIVSQFQDALTYLFEKVQRKSITPQDAVQLLFQKLRANIEEKNVTDTEIDIETFKDLAGNRIEGGDKGSSRLTSTESPQFKELVQEVNQGTWTSGTRNITLIEIPDYFEEKVEKAITTFFHHDKVPSLLQTLFTQD